MAPHPREWPPRGALKGFAAQITANELMDVMRKMGRTAADKTTTPEVVWDAEAVGIDEVFV